MYSRVLAKRSNKIKVSHRQHMHQLIMKERLPYVIRIKMIKQSKGTTFQLKGHDSIEKVMSLNNSIVERIFSKVLSR